MNTIGYRASTTTSVDELLQGALFAAATFLMTAGALLACLVRTVV